MLVRVTLRRTAAPRFGRAFGDFSQGDAGPVLQRENVVVPPDAEETERDKLCPACRELLPAAQGTDDQPA